MQSVENRAKRERRLEKKLSQLFADNQVAMSVEISSLRLLNIRDPLIKALRDTTWLCNPRRVYEYDKSLSQNNDSKDAQKKKELEFDVDGLDAACHDFFKIAYAYLRPGRVQLTLLRPGRLGKYDLVLVDCKSNLPIGVYEFAGMGTIGNFRESIATRREVDKMDNLIARKMADPIFRMIYIRGSCFENHYRSLFFMKNPKAARLMKEQEMRKKEELKLQRKMQREEQIREFLRRNQWLVFILRNYRVLTVIFYNFLVY